MDDPLARARQRYRHRCGYCGVHEHDAGALLTLDHHQPRKHGGTDEDENLVYCCPRCNEHKGSYWSECHPPHIPLLHPLRDELAGHIAESQTGELVGRTPQGAFFIERLHLNRAPLVAYRVRRRRQLQQREEVAALRDRVRGLEERVVQLDSTLRALMAEVEEHSP